MREFAFRRNRRSNLSVGGFTPPILTVGSFTSQQPAVGPAFALGVSGYRCGVKSWIPCLSNRSPDWLSTETLTCRALSFASCYGVFGGIPVEQHGVAVRR